MWNIVVSDYNFYTFYLSPEPDGQLEQDDSLRQLPPPTLPDGDDLGSGGKYVLLPARLLLPEQQQPC